MKSWRLVIGLALVLTLAVIAILVFVPARPVLPSTPSGTNYYPQLVAAAQLLRADPPRDFADRGLLESAVRTNAAAVAAAREALRKPIWSPPPDSGDNNRLINLRELKRIALAMRAEAKLLSLEARHDEQTSLALDLLRMSQGATRGGPLLDALLGLSFESLGVSVLPPLDKIDTATAARIASELAKLDAGRTPSETVWAQEVAWANQVHGLRGRVVRLLNPANYRRTRLSYAAKHAQVQQTCLKQMAAYAVRAFELQHGAPPQAWSDLVPAFLLSVPSDTNGAPLQLPSSQDPPPR